MVRRSLLWHRPGFLALAVFSLFAWEKPRAVWLLLGTLLYLPGTMLVTFRCNIPRNDALAAVDAETAEGARIRAGYVPSWAFWNHLRMAAALLASVSFVMALLSFRKGP